MLLTDIYNGAKQECVNATGLISTSNEFYDDDTVSGSIVYSDEIHCCVINGAYLKLFLAFERFLECSFICYMLGQPGINGRTITRYVTPQSEEHAQKILKGINRFADFTNKDTIVKLAENYFDNAGTYLYLHTITKSFEEMKIIRNAISHISIESEKNFLNLARTKLGGPLPPGTNTATFLNTVNLGSTQTFFVYYRDIILTAIDIIANPT